jgi:riboflavin synthase
MFTGIITDLGKVLDVTPGADQTLTIGTGQALTGLKLGASIACNGICLTVVAFGDDWFRVQASAETIAKTTIGNWRIGTAVNLERPLRAGDELGGHIVSGHVDGIASLINILPDGGSLRLTFSPPAELCRFIAPKGSITIDGVSLTVNAVLEDRFDVNIIPHTQKWTNLGTLPSGSQVNLEVDMLARYLARLLDQRQP